MIFGWLKNRGKAVAETSKRALGYNEIVENAKYIKEAGSTLFKSETKSNIINKSDYYLNGEIAFKDYLDKNGMGYSELLLMSRNIVISHYIVLLGAIICFIAAFVFLFQTDIFFDKVMQVATCLSIGALLFITSLRLMFDAYKIKHQRFLRFKDFWSLPIQEKIVKVLTESDLAIKSMEQQEKIKSKQSNQFASRHK